MTTVSTRPALPAALSDEHSVLLWQACAYADDLVDAVRCGRPAGKAHDAMLAFAHYRLLPYLTAEERQLPVTRLRDDHLARLLRDDHAQIRRSVETIEASRTRSLLALAADDLVERLERHIGREETWVASDVAAPTGLANWALPLLLRDVIDVDAIPEPSRERLVLQRLAQMHHGEVLRLESKHDLHPLWRRHHELDPESHSWVYEQAGPNRWRACLTRRPDDE